MGHCSLKIGNNSRELWKCSNIAGILWSFPPLRGGFLKESPASPGCSPLYSVCFHQVIDVQSQNAEPTDWKSHFSYLLHRWYWVLVCLLCTSAFCTQGANPLWENKKKFLNLNMKTYKLSEETPLRYLDSLCIRIPKDQSQERSHVTARSAGSIGMSEDWGVCWEIFLPAVKLK